MRETFEIQIREDGSRVVARNIENIGQRAVKAKNLVDEVQGSLNRLASAKTLPATAADSVNKLRTAFDELKRATSGGLVHARDIEGSLRAIREVQSAVASLTRDISKTKAGGAVKVAQQAALEKIKGTADELTGKVKASPEAAALKNAKAFMASQKELTSSTKELALAEKLAADAQVNYNKATADFLRGRDVKSKTQIAQLTAEARRNYENSMKAVVTGPDNGPKAEASRALATAQANAAREVELAKAQVLASKEQIAAQKLLTEARARATEAATKHQAVVARLDATPKAAKSVAVEVGELNRYEQALYRAAQAKERLASIASSNTQGMLGRVSLRDTEAMQKAVEDQIAAVNQKRLYASQQGGVDTSSLRNEITSLKELRDQLQLVNQLRIVSSAKPLGYDDAIQLAKNLPKLNQYEQAIARVNAAKAKVQFIAGPTTKKVLEEGGDASSLKGYVKRKIEVTQASGGDATGLKEELAAIRELGRAQEHLNQLRRVSSNQPLNSADIATATRNMKEMAEQSERLRQAQHAARVAVKDFAVGADKAIYDTQMGFAKLVQTLEGYPKLQRKLATGKLPLQASVDATLQGARKDLEQQLKMPRLSPQRDENKIRDLRNTIKALEELSRAQGALTEMVRRATPAERQYLQALLAKRMGSEKAAEAMRNAAVAANRLSTFRTPRQATTGVDPSVILQHAAAVRILGNTTKNAGAQMLVFHKAHGGLVATIISGLSPTNAMISAAKGHGNAAAGAVPGILKMGAAWYYVRRALYSLGGAFFLRELGEYADAWIKVTNRVAISTDNMVIAEKVMQKLYDVSQTTRADMGQIVKVYQRGAQASKQLGASQQDLIDFTQGVGMALAIQGVSAHEAYGALHQLGQALGSARVFSEEFNSINEAAPRILQAVANHVDAAGGSIAALKAMVVKGKLTNKEFFEALLKDLPQLRAEFIKAIPTIGQAFTTLNNAMGKFVGETGQATGITTTFARGIMGMSRHLDDIARSLTVVAAASAMVFSFAMVHRILLWVEGLKQAEKATNSLTLAMLRNPAFLIATAIVMVVTALAVYRNEINLWSKTVKTLDPTLKKKETGEKWSPDVGAQTSPIAKPVNYVETSSQVADLNRQYIFTKKSAEEFYEVQVTLGDYMKAMWQEVTPYIKRFFGWLWDIFKSFVVWGIGHVQRFVDRFIGALVFLAKAVRIVFKDLPNAIGEVMQDTLNFVIKKITEGLNWVIRKLNAFAEIVHAPDWLKLPEIPVDDKLIDFKEYKGAVDRFGEDFQQAFVDSFSGSYTGTAAKAIGGFVSEAFNTAKTYYLGQDWAKNMFFGRVGQRALGNAYERTNKIKEREDAGLGDVINADARNPPDKKDKELESLKSRLKSLMDELDPVGGAFRKVDATVKDLLKTFSYFGKEGNLLEGWMVRKEDQKQLEEFNKQVNALIAQGGKAAEMGRAAQGILMRQREALQDVIDPMGAYLRERQREIEINQTYVVGRKGGIEAIRQEAEMAKKLGTTLEKLPPAYKKAIEEEEELREQSRKFAEVTERIFQSIVNPIRDYAIHLRAVGKVLKDLDGQLTDIQKRRISIDLFKSKIDSGTGNFSDHFMSQLLDMEIAGKEFAQNAGEAVGSFARALADGMSSAIADSIFEWKSLEDAINNVVRGALKSLLQAFINIGIQMMLNKTFQSSWMFEGTAATQAKSAAEIAAIESKTVAMTGSIGAIAAAATAAGQGVATASVAQGAQVAAAWAPAALAASLATEGANSLSAMIGIESAAAALAEAMAMVAAAGGTTAAAGKVPGLMSLSSGGYTGNKDTKEIAGVVHGQEFVVNALGTRRNRDLLELMNRGVAVNQEISPYTLAGTGTDGGSAGGRGQFPLVPMPSGGGSPNVTMKVTVNNESRAIIETEQIGPNEIRIIAREEAKRTLHKDGPRMVASEFSNPNSPVSKSVSANTTAGRKRTS